MTLIKFLDLLTGSKKPIFYVGGGVVNSGSNASHELYKLMKNNFSLYADFDGIGAFPMSDKQSLGMLGMHGTYEANMSMYNCDLMICLGARFDDRITGKVSGFSPNSKKIHFDIDASSFNKSVNVDLTVKGDLFRILKLINEKIKKRINFKK